MEDECHFVVKCPAYKIMRDKLFNHMASNNQFFLTYNDVQKFIWLFSSENVTDIAILARFVKDAWDVRK